MAEDLTGTEILGFHILELLGEGGMAQVWRAEHPDLGTMVAVKVLNPQLANANLVERFVQEARIQVALRHPNIVRVKNFCREPLAMVMEYVPGKTLDEIIGREVGPIPFGRARPYMLQILAAVAHAHEHGVIHRDLKPSNVLVDTDDTIKVMDFGIAKVASSVRLTSTGATLGTALYMSPEQIKGSRDVDERSDIYSLGVTFYEMLAGQAPFEGGADTDSDYLIKEAHVHQAPPDPRQFYPAIPQDVVQWLLRALAKDPAQRYGSAAEMREALDGAAVEAPTLRKQPAPTVVEQQPPVRTVVEHQPPVRTVVEQQPPVRTVVERQPTPPFPPGGVSAVPGWVWGLLAGLGLAICVGTAVAVVGGDKKQPDGAAGSTDTEREEPEGVAGGVEEDKQSEKTSGPVSSPDLSPGKAETEEDVPPEVPKAPKPKSPVALRARRVELLHATQSAVAVSSRVRNNFDFPRHLVDGKLKTAWNSRTKDLKGAWVAFRLPRYVVVSSIKMTAGFSHRNHHGDLFLLNHRVKRIRVQRDGVDLGSFNLNLADRGLQEIRLPGKPRGGVFKITMVKVVRGSKKRWREICISELEVWGQLPQDRPILHTSPTVDVGGLPPE